jgi:hypothetical protein
MEKNEDPYVIKKKYIYCWNLMEHRDGKKTFQMESGYIQMNKYHTRK